MNLTLFYIHWLIVRYDTSKQYNKFGNYITDGKILIKKIKLHTKIHEV